MAAAVGDDGRSLRPTRQGHAGARPAGRCSWATSPRLRRLRRWWPCCRRAVEAEVILEVTDADDEQPLPRRKGRGQLAASRRHQPPELSPLVDDALRQRAIPGGDRHVYVFGESRVVRRLRDQLYERGLERFGDFGEGLLERRPAGVRLIAEGLVVRRDVCASAIAGAATMRVCHLSARSRPIRSTSCRRSLGSGSPAPTSPTAKPMSTTFVHDSVGGENLSPQLSWSGFPAGDPGLCRDLLRSGCADPEWFLALGLGESAGDDDRAGTRSGQWRRACRGRHSTCVATPARKAYAGAAPPAGDRAHRYVFAVHALDVEGLDVDDSVSPAVVGFNLAFHTIARAAIRPTLPQRRRSAKR